MLVNSYTDEDLYEIDEIDGEFIELMHRTVDAAGKVGESKDIAKYDYDADRKYYHVMINPEKNDTGGFDLAGTGIATGLINFLTTGDKGKGNLQEQLIEVEVINLNSPDTSAIYSYEELYSANTSFFGAIDCIEYFIPKDKDLVLGSMVGENYKLIYKYELSSGKEYTREEKVYFSNEY